MSTLTDGADLPEPPDFLALLDPARDELDRARSATAIAVTVAPTVRSADLARCLRQANTNMRRDFLRGQGLSFKRPPSEETCDRILDRLATASSGPDPDLDYVIEFCAVASSAFRRRFDDLENLELTAEPDDDEDDVILGVAEHFADTSPEIIAIALTSWMMFNSKPATLPVTALLIYAVEALNIEAWNQNLGRVREIFEIDSTMLYEDGPLRYARQSVDQAALEVSKTAAELRAVAEFSEHFPDHALLGPIATELESLAKTARHHELVTSIVRFVASEQFEVELDEHPTLQDLQSVVADAEQARSDPEPHPGQPLTQIVGPQSLNDEITAIRRHAGQLIENGDDLDEGLAALVAVLTGSTNDSRADLSTFVHAYPDWTQFAFATAQGEVVVVDDGSTVAASSAQSQSTDERPASDEPDPDEALRSPDQGSPDAATAEAPPGAASNSERTISNLTVDVGPFTASRGLSGVAQQLGLSTTELLGGFDPMINRPAAPAPKREEQPVETRERRPLDTEPSTDVEKEESPELHEVEAEIQEETAADKLEEDGLLKADGSTEPSQQMTTRDIEVIVDSRSGTVDEAPQPSTMEVTRNLIAARKFGTAYWSLINEDRRTLSKSLEFASAAWATQTADDDPATEAMISALSLDPTDVVADGDALAVALPSLVRAMIATGHPSFSAMLSRFAAQLGNHRGVHGLETLASIPTGGARELAPAVLICGTTLRSAQNHSSVGTRLHRDRSESQDQIPTRHRCAARAGPKRPSRFVPGGARHRQPSRQEGRWRRSGGVRDGSRSRGADPENRTRPQAASQRRPHRSRCLVEAARRVGRGSRADIGLARLMGQPGQ